MKPEALTIVLREAFLQVPSSELALPAKPHVPASGSEPDLAPLERAKELMPDVTHADTWLDNATYIYGFALVRAEFFWEAHEVWEPVWLASTPNSRERSLVRALIQSANAALKLQMARPYAAVRLIREAGDELSNLGSGISDVYMGVNILFLRQSLTRLSVSTE